jgi:anti-sigma factor RsiW
MQCQELQRLINRLRDGELPEGESTGVFHHLSLCKECRAFFFALQALDGALARIADRVPYRPASPRADLLASLQPRSWWNQRVALRLPILALLICVIAAGVIMAVPGDAFLRAPQPIYVTKLPTVVVDADTAPPEPRQ